MRTKWTLAVTLVVMGLLAGCTPDGEPAPSTVAESTTTTTASREPSEPSTTTTIDPNAALEEQCGDANVPFTSSGTVGTGGSADSDSSVIEAFTWDMVGPCERVRVGFTTIEGAPAVTPPEVEVRFLRWAGVIRLEFTGEVADAVVAEQVVDTNLIERIYTVTEVDATMFVDIHLKAPAFVRAFTGARPAAIFIDIAPGGEPYSAAAMRSSDIVTIAPDPAATTYPLTVTGYTVRTGDAIEGVLRSPNGSTVIGEAVVGEHEFTWGSFSMVFPDGPAGPVAITVEDGPELDLTIP